MKGLMFWLVLPMAVSLTAGEPAYRAIESSDISLTVNVAERTKKPVSPYLFGKFSEHLGSNIYGGLWAEVLDNPGLDSFGRIVQSPDLTRQQLEEQRKQEVLGAIDRQVPYCWLPFGDSGAEYSFDTRNPLSLPDASVLALKNRPSELTGIEQRFALPSRRCQQYELTLHLRAAGDDSAAVTVQVIDEQSNRPVLDESVSNLGDDWKQSRFTFRTKGQKGFFRLRIGLSKEGAFAVDSLSLMPADNLKGWDPEAIRLIRESQCTMMRFPGGNFVSGYRWEQGIGNPFERPTVPNPAWDGQFEPNRVGSAEWMDFMTLTGCEPLLCINAGDGSEDEASEWLEYVNGDKSTRLGRLRISQGHPDPLNVKFVEVGNELYGPWQVGNCNKNEYAVRYRDFYKKLRRNWPDITYIANGGSKYSPDWNEELLRVNRKTVDGVSLHYLFDSKLPSMMDPEQFYWLAMAQTFAMNEEMQIRQDLFKRYAPDCFLAVTELMLYPKDERYPGAKTIAEALWYSGFINGCMRQGDFVQIITYSASMNHGASLQKANAQIFPTPGWLAYTLYSTAEGRYPCGFELKTPFYEVPRLPRIPNTFREYSSPERAPLLDTFCMSSEDGKILNVFLSNRSLTDGFSVPIKLTGGSFRAVTVDTLSGAGNMLDSNSLKNPDRISITSTRKSISMSSETIRVDIPSLSLVRLTFSR